MSFVSDFFPRVSQLFSRSFHASCLYQKTLGQIIRHGLRKKPPKKYHPLLGNRPQVKGIVLETMTLRPRKPNSGDRKCCRVRLSNKKEAIAFIPGEGHILQPTDAVLVEGMKGRQLYGVKLRVIRGKYNCGHPIKKKQ